MMKNRKHLAMMCATMLGLTGVIASQNVLAVDGSKDNKMQTMQQQKQAKEQANGKAEHKHEHRHHAKGHHVDEQKKVEFEQRRAQFYQQATQACDGKLGQSVEFKIDQQTFKGTCELSFKPNKFELPKDKAQSELPPPPPKGDFKPENGKMFKHRFSREQRQAMDKQVQQACTGKVGQTVSITLDNNVKVNGTCEVRFKNEKPQHK